MVVDSKVQKLSSIDVLRNALENTKSDLSEKQAFTMLNIELGLPNVWKLQQGNTVFITHRVPQPGWGYFRALNADTAPNFLENSKVFIDAAYKAGFDNLVTQFDDPTILNIFKMISRNPPRPQMGYKVDRTNVGGYQVQVKLGPSRIKEGKK